MFVLSTVTSVETAVVALVLIWVAIIDVRRRIIPNAIIFPASVGALLISPLTIGVIRSIEGFAVAGGLFLVLYLLAFVLYRRPGALGEGDVKMAGFIGLAVGYPNALIAVLFSTFVGALIALVIVAAGRGRHATIPYGPALAAGTLISLLAGSHGLIGRG